jgi:hypothetical protein
MWTSEKAQAKQFLRRDQDRYETDRKLHLGKNQWHDTTLIYLLILNQNNRVADCTVTTTGARFDSAFFWFAGKVLLSG